MWPLILLAIGGGYLVYKKTSTPTTSTPTTKAAVANLPPVQNAAVYTASSSPVVQTSNGGQSGIVQNPTPSTVNQGPPVVHAMTLDQIRQATSMVSPTGMVSQQKLDGSDYGASAPVPAPMPAGITDHNGDFWTWDAGGQLATDTTGTWIYNPTSGTINAHTPNGSISLPPGRSICVIPVPPTTQYSIN